MKITLARLSASVGQKSTRWRLIVFLPLSDLIRSTQSVGKAAPRHDRNTNARNLPCSTTPDKRGNILKVFARLNRFVAIPATLGTLVALCGCSFDTSGWFPKPIDPFGTRGTYTYSDLGDARRDRPITANDLVDNNGSCPRPVAAASPAPTTPDNTAAAGNDAALLGGGVAIGMSECDVVQRLGQPSSVNLGTNPNGLRSAVLTFTGGPRPGVYRFEAGRLTEMDRVEQPPAQAEQKPPAKKKIVKKKPAAPAQPAKSDGNG